MSDAAPAGGAVNALFQFSFYFASFAILTAVVTKTSFHVVPQGYVSLYFRFGMLLPRVSEPGIRLRLPIVDTYEVISFRMQTIPVTNLSCNTQGGTHVMFEQAEVTFRLEKSHVHETVMNYGPKYYLFLIRDKIRHEMGNLCSNLTLQELYMEKFFELPSLLQDILETYFSQYASGIVLLGIHVSSPIIPDHLQQQFEALDEERTKVLIAQERLKVQELELEMLKRKALTEAEIEVEKGHILTQHRKSQGEMNKQQQILENEIFLSKQRAEAEAALIRAQKEADANKILITPEYLQLMGLKALASGTKMFFGVNWSSVLQEQGFGDGLFQYRPDEK